MTTDRDSAHGSDAVRDEAALWFARVSDRELTLDERASFDSWLDEHEHHAQEFRLLQNLWGAADLLTPARMQALCEADAPSVLPKRKSRPVVRYAVAASLVVAALGAGLLFTINSQLSYTGQFATALGERRHVQLPDGSVVELNSRTRMDVRYAWGHRRIELTQGEAMFSVEHDASRPFVVHAGSGWVTVTGTRFDVRRDPDETRVVVESGTVKVNGREGEQGAPVILTAGLGSRIDAQGNVSPASAVNTEALTAWRTGKLVFSNATLTEVAQEVSRYREKPLTVAPGKAAGLRLTSVFKADDTDALLKALPNILPVAVRTLADGSKEIIAR